MSKRDRFRVLFGGLLGHPLTEPTYVECGIPAEDRSQPLHPGGVVTFKEDGTRVETWVRRGILCRLETGLEVNDAPR